mgnify:CR=1 FL=1
MRKDLSEILFTTHPSLYKSRDTTLMHFGFSCGDGWFELINTLSALITKRTHHVIASQVKEKFGQLRFYFKNHEEHDSDYIYGLTIMAEILSSLICDKCSLAGDLYFKGYVCTRCKKHKPADAVFTKESVNLPFDTRNIGTMWKKCIDATLQFILINSNGIGCPNLIITGIKKDHQEQMLLEFTGGNEITKGMIEMLLAYSNKIDHETGDLKNDYKKST